MVSDWIFERERFSHRPESLTLAKSGLVWCIPGILLLSCVTSSLWWHQLSSSNQERRRETASLITSSQIQPELFTASLKRRVGYSYWLVLLGMLLIQVFRQCKWNSPKRLIISANCLSSRYDAFLDACLRVLLHTNMTPLVHEWQPL